MKFFHWLRIVAALLIAGGTAALARPVHPTAATTSVGAALAAQLRAHPLVAIGESHRSARFHAFLSSLLHDPGFICRFDDIVVEFGNARLQSVADLYVSGRPVARADRRRIWRDTGQWLVWDSPVYEHFFDTIRALNLTHACPRPLRVLLGDPPIKWDEVRNAADYRRFAERDQAFAEVVEREVIARHHRALLIAGTAHIGKGRAREFAGGATFGELIERRHPGLLFSLLPVFDPAVAARLALPPGGLVVIRDSALRGQSYVSLLSGNLSMRVTVDGEQVWRPAASLTWPPAETIVDGLIFLDGEDHQVLPDPAIYRDPAYQAELRRRAPILREVYGMDFLQDLDALLHPPASAN